MSLEDDIHQDEGFHSEWQKLGVNLTYTFYWSRDKLKGFFSEFDITMQQFNVLLILRGQHPKPVSTSFLRERLLDKMSDTSRIVDRLVKRELVERTSCKTDKRLVDVLITEEGLALLSQIDQRMDDLEDIYTKLSEAEAKQLNWLLDRLRGGNY